MTSGARLPSLSLALIRAALFLAILLGGAGVARAIEVPSAAAPIVVTLNEDRACVILPAPRKGSCSGVSEDIADKVGRSDSVRAFALVRIPGKGSIPVTVTEIDRGTYDASTAQVDRLVADYVSGFSSEVVGKPEVSRQGTDDGPLGVYLRVAVTTRDADGLSHFRTYFFFGKETVYAFIFSNADALLVDDLADRTMRTAVATKSFQPVPKTKPARLLGVVGFVVGVLFLLAAPITIFAFLMLSRRRSEKAAHDRSAAFEHTPRGHAPYGRPPPLYGQVPRYDQPPP